MRRLLSACLVTVFLLPAAAALAQERSCECKDLPWLENQMFLAEYLQMLSREYDTTDPLDSDGYRQAPSTDSFKNTMGECGSIFWSSKDDPKGFNVDCSKADSGMGSSGVAPDQNSSQSAQSPAATDVHDPKCALKSGGKTVTPKQYRDRPNQDGCKLDNDADLAHEAQHAATCRKAFASGHGKDFDNPSFFAADDARSYGVTVKIYRAGIAQLATDCGWEGSNRPTKPDKNKPDKNKPQQQVQVVPTRDQAKQLANALKAGGKK